MSKRGHRASSDRHESFADIVKEVDSDESIEVRPQPVYPAPVRHARRGRLINLVNDAHVPVREFDRWTAKVRTLNWEEAQEVIADLKAGRHEIADFCEGMDVAEARNEEHGSEVWVGRI